jgi:hypothetical protein
MAAISQFHFSKRRTLTMFIVVSSVPFGVVQQIMLNHLLNVSRGVLASAGFVSSLLLIACLSMRTRALSTPSGTSYGAAARKCSRDALFILVTVTTGCDVFHMRTMRADRAQGKAISDRDLFPFVLLAAGLYQAWYRRRLLILLCTFYVILAVIDSQSV